MRDFKTLYTLEERNKIVAYIIEKDIAFVEREDMLDDYEESLNHMYESATDLEIQATYEAWKKESEPSLKEHEMHNKIEDLYILENKLVFAIVDAEEDIKTFNKDLKQVRESIKNISDLVNIEIKSEILNR